MQAELSFLCMTLRIDLFNNPTKYHSNISNGFGVMLRKPIVDARPTPHPTPARSSADVHHFNNQFSVGKPGQ